MNDDPEIDLVCLTRDQRPIHEAVERGVKAQVGVRIVVHRLVGSSLPGDVNRWEAISRARNAAKGKGKSLWLMFLDDDVVLDPHAARSLLDALQRSPSLGAVAANYLHEPTRYDPRQHVAMGATMFRRAAVRCIRFRWEEGRCECQCCCDDLRRLGLGIAYAPAAQAAHLALEEDLADSHHEAHVDRPAETTTAPPRILAAFDRRHLARFRRQFLKSLRSHGNHEEVVAIGYGLYPSECRIEQLENVRLVTHRVNGQLPPVRRLWDFQQVLRALPPDTPVAYWDAGDVIFQSRLSRLWETVRQHPDRLLAVREPKGFPENVAVSRWTLSIRDAASRRRAFELLADRPFLNSGFAAGTARTMLNYFQEAHRLLHSVALRGTTDWGDQTALNLYCHLDPSRWREIDEGWNYCVHDRAAGEVVVRSGEILSRQGTAIHVAHGNALSLRQFGFLRDESG